MIARFGRVDIYLYLLRSSLHFQAMTNRKICENSCCVLWGEVRVKDEVPDKVKVCKAVGQGIFLCDSQSGLKTYWLLTCHHVITSKEVSRGFSVCVYNGKDEECFQLDGDNVGECFSCCGKNGILGKADHFYKSGRWRCPFDLDFTLIEVKGPRVEEILSCIEVIDLNLCIKASEALMSGSAHSFLQTQKAQECYFYQKVKESYSYSQGYSEASQVKYKEHYLQLSWPVPSQKAAHLRDWSSKLSQFDVMKDDESDICGGGSSGAPIYAIHKNGKPLLIGMHIGTEGKHRPSNMLSIINTNCLWVLLLLSVNNALLPDCERTLSFKHAHTPSVHLLWAIFLRYERAGSNVKDNSLLSRVADVIWKELHRSPEQEQLPHDSEEKKIFDQVKKFCKLYIII